MVLFPILGIMKISNMPTYNAIEIRYNAVSILLLHFLPYRNLPVWWSQSWYLLFSNTVICFIHHADAPQGRPHGPWLLPLPYLAWASCLRSDWSHLLIYSCHFLWIWRGGGDNTPLDRNFNLYWLNTITIPYRSISWASPYLPVPWASTPASTQSNYSYLYWYLTFSIVLSPFLLY